MISAMKAKELLESYREELIKVTVKEIYTKITYASKRGLTSLRYISDCNLPLAWQTVYIFQPLMEELTQNGYSVSSERIKINRIDCIQSIEIKWD